MVVAADEDESELPVSVLPDSKETEVSDEELVLSELTGGVVMLGGAVPVSVGGVVTTVGVVVADGLVVVV